MSDNTCDVCGTGIPDGTRYVAVDRLVESREPGRPHVAAPTGPAQPLLRAHTTCAPGGRELTTAVQQRAHRR